MARTVAQIEQSIIVAKNTKAALSDLNSPSGTAIWRLWVHVVAMAIHIHETFWDLFKKEIQELTDKSIAGTPRWYAAMAKEFQLGDTLDVIDGEAVYAVVDASKRIVTHSAVEEPGNNVVVIKVAKTDNGELTKLDPTTEQPPLETYVNHKKFAGTNVIIRNVPADKARFYYTVYYDPLIGQAATQHNAEAAIGTYIETLPFNGILSLTRLKDRIQEAEGVKDAVLVQADSKQDGVSTFTPINRIEQPHSGYYKIDTNHPLSNTITYVPSDVQY